MNILGISLSATAIALIAVGGLLLVQTTRLNAAHSEIETLEADLAAEKQITASQRLTIDSMGRSQARREGDAQLSNTLEDKINEASTDGPVMPIGPIGVAIDGVRDFDASKVNDNPVE